MVRQRLTAREERDLAIAAESGDLAARRALIEAFLPTITALARTFGTGRGVERQELVQEGVAALLFATRRYDSRLDTPFWAYASFWVRKSMQELVAELARPVALSDRAVRGLAQIRAVRREYLQARGGEPTLAQLIRATGLSRSQIESLEATERSSRGMDEPLNLDSETSATLAETIADPRAEEAFEHVLAAIEVAELRHLADQLDERERTVIRGHYGLEQPVQTLHELGTALGVTAERARQIEAGALARLREALVQPSFSSAS